MCIGGIWRELLPPAAHPSSVDRYKKKGKGLTRGVFWNPMLGWLFGSRSVQTRLDDLESTVNSLKSTVKALSLEWESTYQKLHAARVSLNRKLRAVEQNDEEAPEPTNGKVLPPGPSDAELLRRAFPRR